MTLHMTIECQAMPTMFAIFVIALLLVAGCTPQAQAVPQPRDEVVLRVSETSSYDEFVTLLVRSELVVQPNTCVITAVFQ